MITTEKWSHTEVYKLENNDLAVWVAPALGANVYRMKDKKRGVDLLHHPATSDKLKKEGVFWGTPVLFPPNRIANGRFTHKDQEFRFPVDTPEGHSIHGFLLNMSWRFHSLSDADGVTSLSLIFDIMDHPEILEDYPVPLQFEMKLQLSDRRLQQQFIITNNGNSDAPIGLGLHTWFHLAGGKDRWSIMMPFSRIWELGDNMLPTEKLLELEEMKSLKKGTALSGKNFDTIFYIGKHSPIVTCTRDDGYSFSYEASEAIRHWVLHTPAEFQDVLAIEPYSWVTNAPNLSIDPAISGYRVIKAREMFECTLTTTLN